VVVFTAITGAKRDQLRPIVAPADSNGRPIQYVCFTDIADLTIPAGWEIRAPRWKHRDPRRTSRWHKIMAHAAIGEETKHSLWLDGSMQLLVNPWNLVDELLADREIAIFRHHERNCVYHELEMCLRLHRDNPKPMQTQIDRYREEGYPPRRGLWETAAVLRAHTPAMRTFNELWWREVEYGSVRDQLSVNYVAWKQSVSAAYFPGTAFSSPNFKFYPHQPGA
jgi:hypothetical protein